MGIMKELTYNDEQLEVYEAKPQGEIKGGIIVIHEIWALNEHTKNIADRYAAEGYWAIAPNLLAELTIDEFAAKELPLELFNPDPEVRNLAQPKLRALMTPMHQPDFGEKTIGRIKVCFDYLFEQPDAHESVAITGYCFGGSYTYAFAIAEPRLKAAIPFYGHPNLDDSDALKGIACPILAFYGERDKGLIEGLPEVESEMKAAGVAFTDKVYPDCGHAFFNDTNPYAYNEPAATDAWGRALEFLSTNVASN